MGRKKSWRDKLADSKGLPKVERERERIPLPLPSPRQGGRQVFQKNGKRHGQKVEAYQSRGTTRREKNVGAGLVQKPRRGLIVLGLSENRCRTLTNSMFPEYVKRS